MTYHVTFFPPVVCWSTLAEDSAARAFSLGFYESFHNLLKHERQREVRGGWPPWKSFRQRRIAVDEAFKAGCSA